MSVILIEHRWYKPEDWGPTDEKGIAKPVNTVNSAKELLDRTRRMREYMRKLDGRMCSER